MMGYPDILDHKCYCLYYIPSLFYIDLALMYIDLYFETGLLIQTVIVIFYLFHLKN